MTSPIGFVGLGLMGDPMARNLLAAGHPLVVHNRSPAKAQALASLGATVASSPKAVAQQVETIITMLPDSPDVETVVAGPDGILAGARVGTLIVDMSTISPTVTRALAERASSTGVAMLDAPVSGGDVGARDGTLSIMVGGDATDLRRAQPLFDVLGSKTTLCGPIGAGQVVKACNQVVVAAGIQAVAEALVLGSRAGVDPERIVEAIGGGLAGSKVLDVKGSQLVGHEFSPGFRAVLHRKDLGIALETARAYGAALPVTATVDQLLGALVSSGRGDLDHTGLLLVTEELSAPAG